ncbi:MAG: PAS domain S-box protein, partial [Deltaproteobacteria bacterium]|nr:PAS domain S-box protein [Deltaproteobacteria bacterium]
MDGFYKAQCRILERIARDAPCSAVLADIVRLIEQTAGNGLLCSVMLVEDGRIRTGAAPSMPPAYIGALDGLPIGPDAGSCGTAAFLNRIAIASDIASDPSWARYRDLALPFGLRACWSAPITDGQSRVLGTFAMYYGEARSPTERELELIGEATHLAAVALVREIQTRELRDSEERLRAVVEHTPNVAIQWYGEDGRMMFCNEASRRMYGWHGRDVLGHTLQELGFFSSAEETRFAEARRAAAAGEPLAPVEYAFLRADGTIGYLLSTVFKIPHPSNAPCFVCMDVDLTERRRMEELVRAGEVLRARIYASVADLIFCVSVEGEEHYRFLSVNRAFLDGTGLGEEQVVGADLSDVVPEPTYSRMLPRFREAIATRGEVRWEEVARFPAGEKHGEVALSPVFDELGRCTSLVGSVRDLTALRAAEAERRELESRLQQAQRLQSLGTLASGIAHDFNNVLAAISCNVQLAVADPDHHAEHLREVERATQRAAKLVRQILAYGRKSDVRKQRGSLRAAVEEVLQLLRASISMSVALKTQFDGEAFETLFDATQVHQVITNLVVNAVHAIGNARGTVTVSIAPYVHAAPSALELAEGRYLRVAVTDTGHGMDAATIARAFDPFFTTKAPGEGSGLGLSIVHNIMRGHDGAVTVRSAVGEG